MKLRCRPSKTTPTRPPTGLVTQGCYASELRDCDGGPVSEEHYMSQAVTKHLGPEIRVEGPAWVTPGKPYPYQALRARVLCERHNGALREIDKAAGRFFGLLRAFALGNRRPGEYYLFAGEDLERWMLKALLGLGASKNLLIRDETIEQPPPKWLVDILFGEQPMPEGCGMHMRVEADNDGDGGAISIRGETANSDGSVVGITMRLTRLVFSLATVPIGAIQGLVYRPIRLVVHDPSNPASPPTAIEFSWTGRDEGNELVYGIMPRAQAST